MSDETLDEGELKDRVPDMDEYLAVKDELERRHEALMAAYGRLDVKNRRTGLQLKFAVSDVRTGLLQLVEMQARYR